MLAGYLVGGIVPLLLLASTILHSVQGYFLDERKKVLLSQANVISGQVTSSEFLFDEENRSALEETILETSQEKNFRVMILDSSCLVTYDTGYEDVGKTLLLPEVVQALQHKDTAKEQKNGTVYAAASIVGAGDTRVGVVLIVDSLADVHDILGDIGKEAYLLLGTLVLLVLIVMVIISKVFTEPVKNLIDVIRKMSEGHFEQRAKVRGIVHNEIVDLAISCNQMADQLEKVESSRQQFVSKGMCVDFAIHDKGDGNPHAHVMLTMRAMDERGKWLPKSRKVYELDKNGERIKLPSGRWKSHKEDTVDWNDRKYGEIWRHEWEVIQNRYLEANNRPERVDLRSYERQGLDIIPTVHEGAAVRQMEKRGIQTNIGNLNREIKAANSLMKSIRQLIKNLKGWIAELSEKRNELLAQKAAEEAVFLPNLLMKYMEIRKAERSSWTRAGQSRGTSKDLKAVSEALSYLQRKGLSTVEDLENFIETSGKSAADYRKQMKPKETRSNVIDAILAARTDCKECKPVYEKYQKIFFKKTKEKFKLEHPEVARFEKASAYLAKHPDDKDSTKKELLQEQAKLVGEIADLKVPLTEVQEDLKKLRDIRYWVRKATPGTEESKEPPKKQPIKEVLQDKADEKKAQRTAPAQAKHRQQDMEL